MRLRGNVRGWLACAAIGGWFAWNTWPGLFMYFQGDDLTNLDRALAVGPGELAAANLTPFTAVYRPAGAVFYRGLYALAGFDPLPFRVACYSLLALNIWVTWRFARLVTGSAEMATLAALAGSYHKHLQDLYQNGGTIYDILCFTFYYSSACCYIRWRQDGGAWRLAGFAAFAIVALNSKEMAATLPAVLWLYELIYRAGAERRWKAWGVAAITTVAVAVSVAIKTGASSPFAGNADYSTGGAGQFLATTQAWISQLLYVPEAGMSATAAVAALLTPLGMAAALRRKELLFAAALAPILPLPANFITLRNFFVMYIPLAAWATFAGALIVVVRDCWWRGAGPWRGAATFAALGVGLWAAQARDPWPGFERVDPSQAANRALRAALLESCPAARPGFRILLRGDPFERDAWDPVFLAQLVFGDWSVEVHRTKTAPERPPPADVSYDCVLEYVGGGWAARSPGPL